MTSHGVKVAAFNLAEMKSKEADRRAAAAKEAVLEADCELTRQWTQLKAKADLVREASEEADEEARIWGAKLFHAEEELDESRRLSEEETRCCCLLTHEELRVAEAGQRQWRRTNGKHTMKHGQLDPARS
jgi:hypothetical protein